MMDLANADRPTLVKLLESRMLGAAGERRIRARLEELDQVAVTDATRCATVDPPAKKPGKRRGEMNGTETRFAEQVLEPMQAAGEIVGFEYEPMTFRIPGIGRFTPDFIGRYPDRQLRCWEVKGRQVWEKDRIRFKAAVKERPWIWWTMVQWDRGSWRVLYDFQPVGV